VRPIRSLFGRDLTPPGRSLILDEDTLNMPAYEVVRAAGGEAPRIAWGFVAVNGASPSWRVLVEPVDDDFLRARWGPTRYDLLKGKPFGVKRGTATAFYGLAHRLEGSDWTAGGLTSLVDFPGLIGLHLATLYIMSEGPRDSWQYYLAFDHGSSPPRLRTIGWDLDRGLTNWKYDPFGRQRELLAAVGFQSSFLAVLVVSRLLDTDPSFRNRYLRDAERVLNHVLTPAWWEVRRQHPAWSTKPGRVKGIAEFFRERPTFLSGALAKDLGLPPPRRPRRRRGRRAVTIDGHLYRNACYRATRGHDRDRRPPEGRGDFRHFTANGRRAPDPGCACRSPKISRLSPDSTDPKPRPRYTPAGRGERQRVDGASVSHADRAPVGSLARAKGVVQRRHAVPAVEVLQPDPAEPRREHALDRRRMLREHAVGDRHHQEPAASPKSRDAAAEIVLQKEPNDHEQEQRGKHEVAVRRTRDSGGDDDHQEADLFRFSDRRGNGRSTVPQKTER
jgi:hypothetical protein